MVCKTTPSTQNKVIKNSKMVCKTTPSTQNKVIKNGKTTPSLKNCLILYHFVLCTWCCFTNHFRRLIYIYIYIYIYLFELNVLQKNINLQIFYTVYFIGNKYSNIFFLLE